MRASRVALVLWGALILVLLVVEVAELTHLFSLPVQSVIDDPVALVVALVFTTIVALVGAIFIGIYISHRMLSPSGFTPFEEEMLKMRQEVQELKGAVDSLKPIDPPTRPPGAAP
jgi:hypothetical protein